MSESVVTEKGEFLGSLIAAVVIAGLITTFIFVPMYFWSVPWGKGTGPTEETAELSPYAYERWPIEPSEYRVRYTVKVLEGGKVDVLVTKTETVDGERIHVPVKKHTHLDVDTVEGIVLPPEDMFDSYLVVDNTNDFGAQPEGNVTVKIRMEPHEKIPVPWILWGWVIVFSIMVIGFMWSTWGRKGKGEVSKDRGFEPSSP